MKAVVPRYYEILIEMTVWALAEGNLPVVVISCPLQLSGSGPTSSSRRPQSEISGIYFDADLSMRCHIQKTVANCFAILRQLRSIRRSVPTSVYHTLVVALVLSRLDYGNAVLVGPTSLPVQPSAVSAQRCCANSAIYRRSTTLRPHHRHTRQFPLAEGPGAYSV